MGSRRVRAAQRLARGLLCRECMKTKTNVKAGIPLRRNIIIEGAGVRSR